VNKTGVETYGYGLAELLSMSIAQIVDPASLAVAVESIARKVQGEERTPPYEVLTRAKDGSAILVEVSTRIVRDASGVPAYVQGIARDIGQRKLAETEIGASRELLRATLESTADGILVVDAEGEVLHANRRFADLWRIPAWLLEECDDDKLIAFVLEQLEDPEAFLVKVRELYGSHAEDLDSLRFKDGRVFERYSRPLLGSDGLVGRVWSFRDVTEQMRTEAALQESAHRYRQIFEGHSAVQVLVDMETRVVVEPNAAACDFYGYERERFIGMDISIVDTPVPESERTDIVDQADGGRRVFARRHKLASGEVRDVDVFAGPVDVDGKRLLLVIVQDVTERKRAESALATQQRLLEENAVLLERALESERERARRDPLTGALNHAAVTGVLREAIADTAIPSLAMAMVDVDGLKAANDTYGHQMGDALLIAVAEALGRDGAIVGRYGGDEFVALLLGAGREAAEHYRDRVVAALEAAALIDTETGTRVPLDASVGIAIYPEEANAIEDLSGLGTEDSNTGASNVQRRPRSLPCDNTGAIRCVARSKASSMSIANLWHWPSSAPSTPSASWGGSTRYRSNCRTQRCVSARQARSADGTVASASRASVVHGGTSRQLDSWTTFLQRPWSNSVSHPNPPPFARWSRTSRMVVIASLEASASDSLGSNLTVASRRSRAVLSASRRSSIISIQGARSASFASPAAAAARYHSGAAETRAAAAAKSTKPKKSRAMRAAATSDSFGCGACGETFPTQKKAVAHALTHTS
jgi:diguanylate cyclase (GGDEF)-like protein/PAS domain S-box-containing protein